ncbi:MAG: TlpA disulfide reductase family protein [Bacteroidales bacterium]|nr:TlpA disulfide reductase family protein [Bacteroidales bacterium]MDY4175803.1 TlpA disulfide reductase family protein [Bacteroidales bacterium]
MKQLSFRASICASIFLSLIVLCLTACDNSKGRSAVNGVIPGAEGQKVYMGPITLSAQHVVCDSATVAADGSFSLQGQIQSEPTFYNISLADGRSLTVILDSAEVVSFKVNADAKALVGNVKFDKSPINDSLQSVMKRASSVLAKYDANTLTSDDVRQFKDELTSQVFADPRSMVGYYIVFQKIGGHPLFDVMDKRDHQLYSAVATSLQLAYPNSQQVKYLCDYVLGARAARKSNARRDSLFQKAVELNSPDLSLPNKDGNEVTLTSLRGKTVLLFFWSAANNDSRKAYAQLASIYKKYASRGLEIYAVSFDTSKIIWEAATKDANWVNVCDLKGAASPAAVTYNVTSLPSNYILAPDGKLIGKDLFGTRLDNKLNEILR